MSKFCITCESEGHTYMECPRVSFGSMMAGFFGVQPILGPSLQDTARELRLIELERQERTLLAELESVRNRIKTTKEG